MRMRQLRFGAVCVAAIAMVASLPAHAQEYPTKPVTFITPAAAGNSPDEFARLMHADIEKWIRVTREAGIKPQ